MFNLTGSEIIFILLIALVVLGPEKLPGAIRRATKTYAELRKMGDSFQSEFKSVLDEPLREMRETANLIKDQADPKKIAETAERELAAAKANAADTRPDEPATDGGTDVAAGEDEQPPAKIDYFAATLTKVNSSDDAGLDATLSEVLDPIDEWSDPVDSDSAGGFDDADADEGDDYRVASA